MIEAPPVEPPIIFPVMSATRIRSHLWSLLIYGFGIYLGISGIKRHTSAHRPIVLDLFVLLFSLFFFGLSAMLWLRDQGSQIIIHGNRIAVKSGSGEIRSSGLISDIIELRAIQTKSQSKPSSYSVVFSSRRRIVFDRNIPNLDSLLALLEQRTGRPFVINQP